MLNAMGTSAASTYVNLVAHTLVLRCEPPNPQPRSPCRSYSRLPGVLAGWSAHPALWQQRCTNAQPKSTSDRIPRSAQDKLLAAAEAGFQSYLWDNGSTAEFRTVSAPGIYNCTVTDFGTSERNSGGERGLSAGSAGFNSDYVVGIRGTCGQLLRRCVLWCGDQPQTLHTNFSTCGDHTTGAGNMMVVNGAQTSGQNIWCQTIAVQANTDYAFSAWLASAFFESPAQLRFTVNGTPVGTGLDGTTVTTRLNRFYGIWSSGSATSAAICISNLNTFDSGNDFALDHYLSPRSVHIPTRSK